MVNAVRVAADFSTGCRESECSPETTDGREGFLHPYVMEGGVAEVTLRILLRDFDTQASGRPGRGCGKNVASLSMADFPGAIDRSQDRRAISQHGRRAGARAARGRFAKRAHEKLGRTPKLTIIRGGTDGSRLTELGLPTPNLSSGQHNPHSPLEWACLEEMEQSVEMLAELVQTLGERKVIPKSADADHAGYDGHADTSNPRHFQLSRLYYSACGAGSRRNGAAKMLAAGRC